MLRLNYSKNSRITLQNQPPPMYSKRTFAVLERRSVRYQNTSDLLDDTVRPRSLDPFYIVSYLINRAKTSWTYSSVVKLVYVAARAKDFYNVGV